eukprot:GHVO01008724.1.p3 GENE.GHVO01008724.1~~GHVO01008724.1.p3  ORF type:complete len:100 (+),score=12.20 GHVO01008724.1:1031-1330(+)
MSEVMKPQEDWGPANPTNRKAIYATEIQLTPSYFEIDKHFSFPHMAPDSERRLYNPAPPDVLIQGAGSITSINRDQTSVSTHLTPAPLTTADQQADTHV